MRRGPDPRNLRATRASGKDRGRAWAWISLIALAIVAAFSISRVREAHRAIGSVPPVIPAPPNPALAMSLDEAYAAAAQLVGSRRHLESLPYFGRMIELVPEDDWSLRHDYANALQGASMESRAVLGLPVRALRSSFESIQLMRQAMAELDRAQRLGRAPRAAATVHFARARQLGAWGLPWDAFAEARAAAAADPSWAPGALAARKWARRISGPDFSASSDADSDASSRSAERPAAQGHGPRR
jgi:hypothetical protein